MKTDQIQNLVEQIGNFAKKNFEFPSYDREEIKGIIKELISDAFENMDLTGFIKEQIKESTKDIVVKNAVVEDVKVVNAKIVTETRESQEVKDHMKELDSKLNRLIKFIHEVDYSGLINKAIEKSTENVKVTNAIIHNVDVTHAVIKEEDVVVPRIKEELVVEKKTYEVIEPVFREQTYNIKKLVLKDGRVIE